MRRSTPGVNLIDTAPIYGFGISEEIVGKALAGRRDRAVIATKCGMVTNTKLGAAKFRSTGLGSSPNGHIDVRIYNHPDSIREEVELSLKRLQTDRIDLYQTHWQDPTTPIDDTMDALLSLSRPAKSARSACATPRSTRCRTTPAAGTLDSDQERYSMIDRKLEAEQLPYCREHNVAVLAYSPLAMGMLTGKMGPEREFGDGDIRGKQPRFSRENRQRSGRDARRVSADRRPQPADAHATGDRLDRQPKRRDARALRCSHAGAGTGKRRGGNVELPAGELQAVNARS